MKMALVYMCKEVENDNWHEGVTGDRRFIYDEKFNLYFETKEELMEKIAVWASAHFDIAKKDFKDYVTNEIENNRFDYCQTEDGDGRFKEITEENPDGYCADYTFWIKGVYEEIQEYKF